MSDVAAPGSVSTDPSPQSTLVVLIAPSGSETFIDNVTVWPVTREAGDAVKVAVGGRSATVTWEEDFPVEPLLSVALTVIVNVLDVDVPVEL